MLSAPSFFDLTGFDHAALFLQGQPVWQGLRELKRYLDGLTYPGLKSGPEGTTLLRSGVPLSGPVVLFENRVLDGNDLVIEHGDATKGKMTVRDVRGHLLPGASVIMAGAVLLGRRLLIGRGVLVESGAWIKEPAVVGDQTEVRQGAYMRGYCLIGRRCVVGHATEVKHSVFLDDAKAGHFAYVGDSILGNQVNLGAGTKLANLRFTGGEVQVKTPNGPVNTGLRKIGAILGDRVQTGCNSVTNPGTVVGRDSMVLPNHTVPSGYHKNHSIIR